MKQCTKCKETKELTEFFIRKASKDGLNAKCKVCSSLASKLDYKQNPKKHKERVRLYKINNLEKVLIKGREQSKLRNKENPNYLKEYYIKNKDKWKSYKPTPEQKEKRKIKARQTSYLRKGYLKNYNQQHKENISLNRKLYKKNNKGKINSYGAKRRNLQKVSSYSQYKDVIQLIYQTTQDVPQYFHVDHVIPLNHPDVCGLHVPWNLQILTKEQNLKKGNKFDGTNENSSWFDEL